MNDRVYYLSFFVEQGGFLFPDELPDDYYSPGLFIVERNQYNEYPDVFLFDAMDNGRRVSLHLERASEGWALSTLYVVRTERYGSFWFQIEEVNPSLYYLGRRVQLQGSNNFGVAITTDERKLELACQEHSFYFIGSTLRESDS
jgi:hypothetical protein